MNSCPVCGMPKDPARRACVYCEEAGRTLAMRQPKWLVWANRLSVALAVGVVGVGFYMVFLAPYQADRPRQTPQKPVRPEIAAKCAELRELYRRETAVTMRVEPGDGRVTARLQFLEELRAQMRKLGCDSVE